MCANHRGSFWSRLRLKGTCCRLQYFMIGVIAFGVKFTVDRWLWQYCGKFKRPFVPWTYLDPNFQTYLWDNPFALAIFSLVSVVFLWIGVSHTILRLRDADLPVSLAFLFFVPFLNIALFLILSVVPTASNERGPIKQRLLRLLPNSALGAAVFSVLITGGFIVLLAVYSSNFLRHYGGGLFLGAPVVAGFSSVLFAAQNRKITLAQALFIGNLTILVAGVGLLLCAFEGIICLLMAAPIGCVLASIGSVLAWFLLKGSYLTGVAGIHSWSVVTLVIFIEPLLALTPPILETTTTITIPANRETVWRNVIAFSEIEEEPSLLFRYGLAYPIRARIQGQGVGAVRHCEFSTGAFVEPIEVWDEPRELRFSVTHTPAPMEEWSPWGGIEPAHINGFFLSKGGRFLLEEVGEHQTMVKATTWHEHRIWPTWYWRWWADFLIHEIHLRVLHHIKLESIRTSAPNEAWNS
jgi:uncharacterized membrane protein YhaH (DUF805 family)